MAVHDMAVVDAKADIAETATIGPFCMIGPEVTIHPGVELISHVTVIGKTTIGADTKIFPGAVLGGDPQDLKFKGENSEVVIGERCRIHECATINKGTAGGGMLSSVGDDTLVMAYAHMAHDCRVGSRCVIGNNSQLAGHIVVEDRAIISGMVGVHHFVTIGELSFVGAMSGVRNDVPPFCIVEGYPAEPRNLNVVGLKRAGWQEDDIKATRAAFRKLFHDRSLTKAEALAAVQSEANGHAPVHRLCDWLDGQLNAAIKGRLQEAER